MADVLVPVRRNLPACPSMILFGSVLATACVFLAASPSGAQTGKSRPKQSAPPARPKTAAQPGIPPAPIQQNEGGPVRLFTTVTDTGRAPGPTVVLLDQTARYVRHDGAAVAPPQGQLAARKVASASGLRYALELPTQPAGETVGADKSACPAGVPGIQIWTLVATDAAPERAALLPPLDQQQALLSSVQTRSSDSPEEGSEPFRGTVLVWASQAGATFPRSFGPDGKLFTPDDPLVALPKGYTVVTLDKQGFVFDRSRVAQIPLAATRTVGATAVHLHKQTYTEAFTAFTQQMQSRFVGVGDTSIDWAALQTEFLPQIRAAEEKQDAAAHARVYAEIAQRLKDAAAVFIPALPQAQCSSLATVPVFAVGLEGGTFDVKGEKRLLPGVVRLDDGRVFVVSVLPGSAAEKMGIVPGCEIVAVNGQPIADYLRQQDSLQSGPTSQARLADTLRFLFPAGGTVRFTLREPEGGAQFRSAFDPPAAVTPEFARVAYGRLSLGGRADLSPYTDVSAKGVTADVADRQVTSPSGQGYISISLAGLSDRAGFLAAFEARLREAIRSKAPGIVLDLRGSGSDGDPALAARLASYFFPADAPLSLEPFRTRTYDDTLGSVITTGPFGLSTRLPVSAPEPDLCYRGKVALLIGAEGTSGTTECFAAWMQQSGRAALIGTAGTRGGGRVGNSRGTYGRVDLPDGGQFRYTTAVQIGGKNARPLEGRGVQPDVRVRPDATFVRALIAGRDPVQEAALSHLDRMSAPSLTPTAPSVTLSVSP